MSGKGKRFFLDTNAIVALLTGNKPLLNLLHNADCIATSVICAIEFLSFSGLSEADRTLFQKFLQRVDVFDLCAQDSELIERILAIRMHRQLKLPDAIIAATAAVQKCTLVTADERLLKTKGIDTLPYS